VSRVRENRTHGSKRRGLETERPVMVTAVNRPAGKTREKWLPDLTPDNATAPAAGGGEQAQPQPFGFPGAGRAVQSEHLHPGGQLAGHGHQLAPQLVGREALQREVAQPGVLGGADAVLRPCAAAVA
jgi:hypothetical protein